MRVIENDSSTSLIKEYVELVCPENPCADLLLAISECIDEELPFYAESLENAFSKAEPVFSRKRYAEFFWHCASTVPSWLAKNVLTNAGIESDGSAKLYTFWQGINYNEELEDGVLEHAKDESRHSRLFLQLARRVFPNTIPVHIIEELDKTLPDIRRQEYKKSEDIIPEDMLIDNFVQMNIAEVRTRCHMFLMAPVLCAFTPKENKNTVQRILESLVRDEVRHIAYTARLMEKWARDGDHEYIKSLYDERMHDFNLITIEQTQTAVRDYSQGRFPDLLEL